MFWSLVKKGPIPNKASATLLIGLAHLVLNLDIFYRHLLKKLLLEQGNIQLQQQMAQQQQHNTSNNDVEMKDASPSPSIDFPTVRSPLVNRGPSLEGAIRFLSHLSGDTGVVEAMMPVVVVLVVVEV